MKWTNENIEKSIRKLADDLGIKRMPTSTEMRNNRMTGLSRAISMTGGMYEWAEKLGLPMKKRQSKWNKNTIIEDTKKAMVTLGVKRMPTASELMSIGRNDLHCAISKRFTYSVIAKHMNIEMKSSETNTGNKYEDVAKRLIESKGYQVKKMTTKHPFDLLVEGNVKIDVKMGAAHYHFGSRAHTFRPSSEYSTCDIYVCFAVSEKGSIENVFIIPSKFAKVVTINVGSDSKYNKFIEKWNFIDDYVEFYNSVVVEKKTKQSQEVLPGQLSLLDTEVQPCLNQ